jgi:hypothetical protein
VIALNSSCSCAITHITAIMGWNTKRQSKYLVIHCKDVNKTIVVIIISGCKKIVRILVMVAVFETLIKTARMAKIYDSTPYIYM